MDFLDRLRHLATAKGYENNMQLSKASGVPYTTLDGFYRTGYENVKLSTLRKLADCLECSLEYLVNGNSAVSDQPSSAALDLVRKFDRLDSHSQKVITALVDLELKRPVSNIDAAREAMSDAIRRHEEAALLTNQAAAE